MLTAMEEPDESPMWHVYARELLRNLRDLWDGDKSAETLLLGTMKRIRETRHLVRGGPDDKDLAELLRHLDAVTEASQAITVDAPDDPELGVAFSRTVLELVQWLNGWVLLSQPPRPGPMQ